MRRKITSYKLEEVIEQQGGAVGASAASSLVSRDSCLSGLGDRKPAVPFSPATGLATSLRVLAPAGQSTPLSSPRRCPTLVITPNPQFSQSSEQASLEWDNLTEGLVGVVVRRVKVSTYYLEYRN